jgi:hypothetical protein
VLVADACVSNVASQHDPQYARRPFAQAMAFPKISSAFS